jgi:FtsP/CotA-like multicopper oxidase with cupredoxin domain
MYYSHHDTMTQEGMGLIGMFIIHPREPSPGYRVDRDFAIMLSEWRIDPGTYRPGPNEMNDFNVLTMNGKAYPGTEALVARMGDRIRIRLGKPEPDGPPPDPPARTISTSPPPTARRSP